MTVNSRKGLLGNLSSNIDRGENEFYEFEGYSFYRDGESSYKIFNLRGDDMGIFDLSCIDKDFLRKKVGKKGEETKITKKSYIKCKGRKKKSLDLILIGFMRYLHSCRCVVVGCQNTNIEAHHIFGRQPYRFDNMCVPLCSEHHRGGAFSWHEGDVKRFRAEYSRERLSVLANGLFKDYLNEEGQYAKEVDLPFCLEIAKEIGQRNATTPQTIKEVIEEKLLYYDL